MLQRNESPFETGHFVVVVVEARSNNNHEQSAKLPKLLEVIHFLLHCFHCDRVTNYVRGSEICQFMGSFDKWADCAAQTRFMYISQYSQVVDIDYGLQVMNVSYCSTENIQGPAYSSALWKLPWMWRSQITGPWINTAYTLSVINSKPTNCRWRHSPGEHLYLVVHLCYYIVGTRNTMLETGSISPMSFMRLSDSDNELMKEWTAYGWFFIYNFCWTL